MITFVPVGVVKVVESVPGGNVKVQDLSAQAAFEDILDVDSVPVGVVKVVESVPGGIEHL